MTKLHAVMGLLAIAAASLDAHSADDPNVIMARSRAAYAALTSYQDDGVLEESDSVDMSFATSFVRPEMLHVEWTRPVFFFLKQKETLQSDGQQVHIIWESLYKVEDEKMFSLANGVAGATGISRRIAHHIATLLIADLWKKEPFGSSVLALRNATHRGIESIDGVPCDHLSGELGKILRADLWIGVDDHLIRRIDEEYKDDKTSEWHHHIKTDIAIPPTVFAIPKPS